MKYTSPLIREILTSPSAQKALDRISPIYMDSKIGLWILQSIGLELDELREIIEDIRKQALPQTTTWAIDYWEQEYGIPVNIDLPLEEIRRPRLLNKIRSRAPMNPAKLVKLIKTEINNQSIPVEIIEHVHKNTFRIKITPGSFHTNWKQIYKLVDRVKPAHVIYTIFMYDLSKFYVPIYIDSRLNIISDFYVRKGAVPWFLNGSEFLNNGIYLNGYKGNIEIDYYPLNLLIKDYIDVKIYYLHIVKYPLNFKVDIKQDSRLNIVSDFEVRHLPSPLYIDGSWLTDGTYKLNGYNEDIYPNYYPLKLSLQDYINPKVSFLYNAMYHSNAKTDIKTTNKLDIKSDFEVRHIPNPLYIDGNWVTDGAYRLNGGKEEVYPNYYPLKLSMKSNLGVSIKTQTHYNYIFNASKEILVNSSVKFTSNSNVSLSSKNNFDLKSEYKTNIKYGENSSLTVNKNLWYLNGSFFLDGENNLEPKTTTYKI